MAIERDLLYRPSTRLPQPTLRPASNWLIRRTGDALAGSEQGLPNPESIDPRLASAAGIGPTLAGSEQGLPNPESIDPRLASAAGIGPTLAGSEPPTADSTAAADALGGFGGAAPASPIPAALGGGGVGFATGDNCEGCAGTGNPSPQNGIAPGPIPPYLPGADERARIEALDNDPEFQAELDRITSTYGVTREEVYGIIAGESSYRADAISPGGGYGGLFQLGVGTMGLDDRYTSQVVARMTPAEQIRLYGSVLDFHAGRGWTAAQGLGILQAAPALSGWDANRDLGGWQHPTVGDNPYAPGGRYYNVNPGWVDGVSGRITPRSINEYYSRRNPPPIAPGATTTTPVAPGTTTTPTTPAVPPGPTTSLEDRFRNPSADSTTLPAAPTTPALPTPPVLATPSAPPNPPAAPSTPTRPATSPTTPVAPGLPTPPGGFSPPGGFTPPDRFARPSTPSSPGRLEFEAPPTPPQPSTPPRSFPNATIAWGLGPDRFIPGEIIFIDGRQAVVQFTGTGQLTFVNPDGTPFLEGEDFFGSLPVQDAPLPPSGITGPPLVQDGTTILDSSGVAIRQYPNAGIAFGAGPGAFTPDQLIVIDGRPAVVQFDESGDINFFNPDGTVFVDTSELEGFSTQDTSPSINLPPTLSQPTVDAPPQTIPSPPPLRRDSAVDVAQDDAASIPPPLGDSAADIAQDDAARTPSALSPPWVQGNPVIFDRNGVAIRQFPNAEIAFGIGPGRFSPGEIIFIGERPAVVRFTPSGTVFFTNLDGTDFED